MSGHTYRVVGMIVHGIPVANNMFARQHGTEQEDGSEERCPGKRCCEGRQDEVEEGTGAM